MIRKSKAAETHQCIDQQLISEGEGLDKANLPTLLVPVLQSIHVLGFVPEPRQGRRRGRRDSRERAGRFISKALERVRGRAAQRVRVGGEKGMRLISLFNAHYIYLTSSPTAVQTNPPANKHACRATTSASFGERALELDRACSRMLSRDSIVDSDMTGNCTSHRLDCALHNRSRAPFQKFQADGLIFDGPDLRDHSPHRPPPPPPPPAYFSLFF